MKKTIIYSFVLTQLLYANEFNLGEIKISSNKELTSTAEIEEESFLLHNQDEISKALDSVSGVFLSQMGGRNESSVSIRGFDARRVSVYVDGIPISVPYDGNFDYSRFLTSDLSKISISKGFSSVTYGANTMAGVINLISKKPTKEFEGDVSLGFNLDNDGDFSSYNTALNLGGKKDKYYFQLSVNLRDKDHFNLSDDFVLNSNQPTKERLKSNYKDAKGSFKFGFTPNENSEYVVEYVNQQAKKGQPPVTDTTFSKAKYWDWPYYDKESLYLFTNNSFGDSYLKTRLYKDIYKNSLLSYDDLSFLSMKKGYAFDSHYDDYSIGASVEYGREFKLNEIKLALLYKQDVHRGYNVDKTINKNRLDEDYSDETISLALEDIYKIDDKLNLVSGISYDTLKPKKLYDTNPANISMGEDSDSFNPQMGLFYKIDKQQNVNFTIAQKTHLPTMKERYSRRLGSAVANPDLEAEKALHYELSYSNLLTDEFNFKTNLFLIDISDAIENRYHSTVDEVDLVQNQNIGDFRHSGFELELNHLSDKIESGANYTYINVENQNNTNTKRLGIPTNSVFLYTKYNFYKDFSFYANLKYQTGVYSYNNNTYFKTENFTTVDTKLIYSLKGANLEVGIRNLLDENYEYDSGFPEAGREFFANLRYRF